MTHKSWIGSKHIPKLNKRTRDRLIREYSLDNNVKQFISENGKPRSDNNWYSNNGTLYENKK